MKSTNGADIFTGMPGSDIRAILQKVDSHKARIFSEDCGFGRLDIQAMICVFSKNG
jgi:hypothetical protein